MRGFEIERTLDEDTCSMETLPEKILKVPGIALVAAGTPACLIGLYDSAARINSLDRLFLCQISSVEYSLGKQGKKIWEAVELAANTEGIRGVIIYSSCMEVLTMWDFQREKKKIQCKVPVEILYRGPLVKRLATPLEELKMIFDRWNIEIDELNEKKSHSLESMESEESLCKKKIQTEICMQSNHLKFKNPILYRKSGILHIKNVISYYLPRAAAPAL